MTQYATALTPQMRAVVTRMTELNRGDASRYDLPFKEARVALLQQRGWWLEEAPAM